MGKLRLRGDLFLVSGQAENRDHLSEFLGPDFKWMGEKRKLQCQVAGASGCVAESGVFT